jgi:sugar fermentation stimulation protein A
MKARLQMQFSHPLVPAMLLRRYKRFLADVRLEDGREVTVHVANPGAMLGLATPGHRIWLSPNANPKAKLDWRWELEELAEGQLVGINTVHPNRIVAEAIQSGLLPSLAGYQRLRQEVPYGAGSRVDIVLEGSNRSDQDRVFVEVKNVHLKRGAYAEFPDSVTSRGAKHLAELAAQVAAGARAVMVYCVQRGDCDAFRIAEDLDPAYAKAFAAAQSAGVETMAFECHIDPTGIRFNRLLPVKAGNDGPG